MHTVPAVMAQSDSNCLQSRTENEQASAAVHLAATSQHFAASAGFETELDWLLRCQMAPSELAPGCLDLTLPASQVGHCTGYVQAKVVLE